MLKDYADLVAEATHRAGVSDAATRAGMHVGMAESALSQRLRVPSMQAEATLVADTDGVIELPDDCIAVRAVSLGGQVLSRRMFARHGGWATHGRDLRTQSPQGKHVISYYAAIPSLEANNTNWLLTEQPELYLQAVIFQIYTASSDYEKAQATAAYVSMLIDEVNRSSLVSRFANTKINHAGVRP